MKILAKAFLCILTIISVILLMACTPSELSGNTDPQAQEQNKAAIQPSTHPTEAESVCLDFQTKLIQTDPDDSVTYPQIQLLNLAETTAVIDDLKALHSQYKSDAPQLGAGAEELSYDEAYFESKSLVLVQTTIPVGISLTVSQIMYDGASLKVTLEYPAAEEGAVYPSAFGYWCIFIEVSEKLPDTTAVSIETVAAES